MKLACGQGLRLDADGLYHYTNAVPLGSIRNNVWDVNVQANTEGTFIFTTASFTNVSANALLGGISYTNNGVLDPRPQSGSPLLVGVLTGGVTPVTYRGAFSGPADGWADGWTALSQYGYLKTAEIGTPTAPALTVALDAGNLRLTFFGENGVSYRVESSSDLGTWSPMGGGNEALSEPVKMSISRFRRAPAHRSSG